MSPLEPHDPSDVASRSALPTTGGSNAARVTAMLEHPTLAVAVVDGGRVRTSNAAWGALFAVRIDVSVESHPVALFPSSNSAERFERSLRASFASAGRLARVEHMLLRRDGAPFMAEVVVQSLDETVAVPGIADDAVWQVRDITAERELRRELRELEEYYRALSTYQWDLTFVVDRRDCISFASPSVESALGHLPHNLLGEPFVSLLAIDGATAGMQWLRASREGRADRPRDSFRLRVQHRDGGQRVLSCRLRDCLDVPRIAGLVINARDVTEEVDEEIATQGAQERSSRLRTRLFELATAPTGGFGERIAQLLQAVCEGLDASAASYWQVDPDSDVIACTHSFLAPIDFLAIESREVGDPYDETFDRRHAPAYARELEALQPIVVRDVLTHETIEAAHRDRLCTAGVGALLDLPVALEGRLLGVVSVAHAPGPRAWGSDEIDFAGGVSLLVALAIESRQREETAARMAFMALHDGLTGLGNRRFAEQELERRIATAATRAQTLAVAMVDLDEFKEVNDGHGHAIGDALLVAVGRLLVEAAGDDALVARMGGDEFLVACVEAAPGAADVTVKRVLARIGDRTLVEGIEQQVGASIGVARFPRDGTDVEALLSAADLAMYEAKLRGRGQAFAFDARLAERIRLQRELDAEIRDALANDEFCLFYQPQVDLLTQRTVGLEALLRWRHPTHGLLLPEAFIGAALHRGMVDSITRWVMTQVCEQILAWRRIDPGVDLPVSINLTERQFHDRRLPAVVAGALMKSALPARMLIFEVTEASLTGDEQSTNRVVRELDRLGIRLSVANFGSALGALTELKRRSVAQVKLDRRFVAGLSHDRLSEVIVEAVVEIASRLDCQLIAEGVETRQQCEQLRGAGCAVGQGFFFGAPLPADDALAFLRDEASRAGAATNPQGSHVRTAS